MENKIITYKNDKCISMILETYIIENYKYVTIQEREKLKTICVELYYFLLNKERENKVNVKSKDIDNKFKIKFIDKRRPYTFYLNILQETNLISRNNHYSNDINKPFTKEIIINDYSDRLMNENINYTFNKERIFSDNELNPKEYWINTFPEQEQMINYIYNLYYDIEQLEQYLFSLKGTFTKKGKLIDNILINNYINIAIKFNHRIYTFTKTNEGRFYNPVAYQPSLIRKFLMYDNQYLVELDIKNSQPLLLSLFIDCKEYSLDVQSGLFYDNVSKELNKSREYTKRYLMKYLFFSNKPLSYKYGKLYSIINRLYPNFMEQLNTLKENQTLWALLQSKESDIIISNIGKLNIQYVSIHDGIMIENKHLECFKNYIINIYDKLGLNVKIN